MELKNGDFEPSYSCQQFNHANYSEVNSTNLGILSLRSQSERVKNAIRCFSIY